MERTVWTDERLDDRFDRIDQRFDELLAEVRELRREVHHFMIAVFGMFAAQTAAMVAIATQI